MSVFNNRLIVTYLWFFLVLVSTRLQAEDKIENLRPVSLIEFGLADLSGNKDGFVFSVFVVEDSVWTLNEVAQTIRETVGIYAKQCDFNISVRSVQRGTVARHLQDFNESRQAQLLSVLNPERPTVFFVRQTQDRDIAYAYLEHTPSPSQGTIWITRRAKKECRGLLLAHEIGSCCFTFSFSSGRFR